MSKINKMLIYTAFVFSGIAGLIYESVWSQYLGLFLGHAAYAQTLTLAIFMGGMSIGAWFVSKRISKLKNALMLYVIIEICLGLFGLFFHEIFSATIKFSFGTLFPSINNPIIINSLKWLIASILILPQSILLGSTFPLICSGLIRRIKSSEGKIISILYFTNSIGAAFGALIATFILIPNMGMPGALLVAAILNILIAIIIYIPSKNKESTYTNVNLANSRKTSSINISYNLIFVVAALTGFASFIYEITWIRMLNLVLGTTLHSFEIMLSAFIFGLALGGYWIKSRIDNIKDVVKYLGAIQLFMGTFALLTMPLYLESFSWVAEILQSVLQKSQTGYIFYNILTASLAAIIMIPAAFCAGMTLPMLTNILFKMGDNESAIGKIYSFNTIGALLGVWFAIHIGMTLLGLKYMLIFAASIDAILGMALIFKSSGKELNFLKNKLINFYSLMYLSILTIIIATVNFSPSILASGTYRSNISKFDDSTNIEFYEDGKSASISVVSKIIDGDQRKVIATNGKPDAGLFVTGTSFTGDEPTMVLLGTLPLLIKPNAQKIANIGFGSGLTTHTLLTSKNIVKLDTIEIENEIIDGSKHFNSRNYRAYTDPRSNIILDDAKTYFAGNNSQYDIIVSEPSNPWVLGVGNLFSVEFYNNIKRYLTKDGLLVQWIQLYEIRPQVLSSAINALSSEFKYFNAYLANSSDLILIASNEAINNIEIDSFEQIDKDLQAELKRINIENLDSILTRQIGTSDFLSKYSKGFSDSINSDYFPIIGLEAPKDRFMRASSNLIYDYHSFNVPAFNLIGTQAKFNNVIKNKSYDKLHPFIPRIISSDVFLTQLMNEEDSILYTSDYVGLQVSSYGLISIFNNPGNFCGKNKILEEKWLDAFVNIYDLAVIFGNEKLQDVFILDPIQKCLDISTENSTELIIKSLELFSKSNHRAFIDYINSNFKNLVIDNFNIKRSILNKALYSIILTQSSENYSEIIQESQILGPDSTSQWLMSFFNN